MQKLKLLLLCVFINFSPLYGQANIDSLVYVTYGKADWSRPDPINNENFAILKDASPLEVMNAFMKLDIPDVKSASSYFTHFAFYYGFKEKDIKVRRLCTDFLMKCIENGEANPSLSIRIQGYLLSHFECEDYSDYGRSILRDHILKKKKCGEIALVAASCEMTEVIPALLELYKESEAVKCFAELNSTLCRYSILPLARLGYPGISEQYCKVISSRLNSFTDLTLNPGKFAYIRDSISLNCLEDLLFNNEFVSERIGVNDEWHGNTAKAIFALRPLTYLLENFPIEDRSVDALGPHSILSAFNPKGKYTLVDVETARAWFRTNPEIIFKKH